MRLIDYNYQVYNIYKNSQFVLPQKDVSFKAKQQLFFKNTLSDKDVSLKNITDNLSKYKNKINIVFADIDGTLSAGDDLITEKVYSSVKKLAQKNIPLILTTARSYSDAYSIIKILPEKPEYTIALQGGSIYTKDGNAILNSFISDNNTNKLIKWFNKFSYNNPDLNLILYFNDNPYSLSNIQYPWKSRTPLVQVNSFSGLLNKSKLQKAVLFKTDCSPMFSAKLISDFKNSDLNELQIHKSGSDLFEIQNRNVSKDKAIQLVLNRCDLKAENAMAIGDSGNDISMLDYIRKNNGLAVAMGNSSPELYNHANALTTDIYQDGFSLVIDNIL